MKTKKLYEAQNGEELTSSIYADLLNANPQNLRRMLTHKREIDTRLLEEAKSVLKNFLLNNFFGMIYSYDLD